jgi:hypothetical protein
MGEAKRRREAGTALAPTDLDKKHAMQNELWRIKRQHNGDALKDRLRGSGVPWDAWPKEARNG